MAKKKLQARVRYYKADNEMPSRYAIEIYDRKTGEWNLSSAYPFVKRYDHPEVGDNFIYYGIIIEILDMLNMGYEIVTL